MNGGPAVRGPLLQGVEPRRAAMTLALAIAALGWVYSQILYHMVLHWRHVPAYNHGFLVAPLAAWFAWERRADLRRATLQGSWLGLIPLALGTGSLAVGRLGVELMTMRAGFVLSLIGLVLLLLGRQAFRILAFPLLFLFLMVPLPESLLNVIAFPLQLVAAQAAVASLHWLGIPSLLEGNIIHLAHAELFVEQACSGIRSLMSLITLSVIFAHFFQRVAWERVVLVLSTVPIAVLVNALRVALTGILAHVFGEEAATGFIHDAEGVLTFGIALGLLLGVASALQLLTRPGDRAPLA
jgi:exosortase